MKLIPLSRGQRAAVDDSDYEWLNQWKWSISNPKGERFYAYREVGPRKRRRAILMHRLILGLIAGDGRQADHVDGDGLNNQRNNLRACTPSQNNQNSRKRRGCSSAYKGVLWSRRDSRWLTRIKVEKRCIHLGYFTSEKVAAQAYNEAALKHFGEFARINDVGYA